MKRILSTFAIAALVSASLASAQMPDSLFMQGMPEGWTGGRGPGESPGGPGEMGPQPSELTIFTSCATVEDAMNALQDILTSLSFEISSSSAKKLTAQAAMKAPEGRPTERPEGVPGGGMGGGMPGGGMGGPGGMGRGMPGGMRGPGGGMPGGPGMGQPQGNSDTPYVKAKIKAKKGVVTVYLSTNKDRKGEEFTRKANLMRIAQYFPDSTIEVPED